MPNASDDATTILVTPVWNDSRRLEPYGRELAAELSRRRSDIRWIIADDGSRSDEKPRLEALLAEYRETHANTTLHLATSHRGKGAVVREAWGLAPDAAWLAFVDADGSVSAADMLDLIDHARGTGHSALGVRVRTEKTHIEEGLLRGLRHRGFLAAVRLIIGVRSADTQCGAKVLRGPDFRSVANKLCEPGWAFDAELLAELHAAGHAWDEVPVNWIEKGQSRIRPWADSFNMLAALLRIRRRMRSR